jgi:hypothetical protein
LYCVTCFISIPEGKLLDLWNENKCKCKCKYMFRPNRPPSGVQVAVMKECAAHCNAVLLFLCSCLGLILVLWVNHLFIYIGVPELHMFALSVICSVNTEKHMNSNWQLDTDTIKAKRNSDLCSATGCCNITL